MICWSWRLVSTKAGSCCPLCFCPATRCHSHYARVVADLPCAGFRVQLILHVRRFFCDHTDCIRKIFTERLPAFVLPWARLTVRLCEALQSVGLSFLWRVGNPTCGASRYSNVANHDPSPYHGPSNSSRRTRIGAWNRGFLFPSWKEFRHDPGRYAKPPDNRSLA